MNEQLTKRFMEMKWEDSYSEQLSNLTDLSESNVIQKLNSIFPKWSYTIESVNQINNQMVIAGTLYLPDNIRSGIGNSDNGVLYNIIRTFIGSVNTTSTEKQNVPKKTLTSDDVVSKLQEMKNNISNKESKPESTESQSNTNPPANNNNSLFNDLLNSMSNNKEEKKEEPKEEYIPYPPETEEDKKKLEELNKAAFGSNFKSSTFSPTPEFINPKNEIMLGKWTQEEANKIKQWCATIGVSNKDEMSAWIKRFCNLDYDHFDPQYVDKFIEWSNELREKQSY